MGKQARYNSSRPPRRRGNWQRHQVQRSLPLPKFRSLSSSRSLSLPRLGPPKFGFSPAKAFPITWIKTRKTRKHKYLYMLWSSVWGDDWVLCASNLSHWDYQIDRWDYIYSSDNSYKNSLFNEESAKMASISLAISDAFNFPENSSRW